MGQDNWDLRAGGLNLSTGRTKVKLLSIETTPNPNSMKLNLDERLAKGIAITYTNENK